MQVILKKLSEIKPYDRNPRNNTAAIEKVAASIKQFGWKQPIVLDKAGVIIVGHTRYEAAKLIKLAEVPVLVADDLLPAQCQAYRIADNATASVSEWNLELLMQECAAMPEVEFKDFGLDLEAELLKAQGLTPDDGSEDSQEGVKQNDKITVIIDDMSQKAEIKAAIEAAIEGLEAHVK
jgi:hypothetical protein